MSAMTRAGVVGSRMDDAVPKAAASCLPWPDPVATDAVESGLVRPDDPLLPRRAREG